MAAAVDEALALEAEAAEAEQEAAQAPPRTPPLRGFTFVVAGFDASEAAAPFDVEECVVPSPISKECLWTKADEVGAAQRRYESAAVEGFRDSRKGNAF